MIIGLMSDQDRLSAAWRLIRAAGVTEDDFGSSDSFVTDAGIGYAYGNGGMSGMSDVWVTGNWNDIDRYDATTQTRVTMSKVPGRLFDALERLGVNGEWLDENDRCADCSKLIRTQPDSYGWTAQYLITDDGDIVCHDCAKACAETFVEDMYANNVDRALTWLSEDELAALGWSDAMPDQSDAQHGLHPGQNDTPDSTLAAWRDVTPDSEKFDYVFIVTDKGQFDMSYRLYVKRTDDDNE